MSHPHSRAREAAKVARTPLCPSRADERRLLASVPEPLAGTT